MMLEQRQRVEIEAARLPAATNMYFWCRVTQQRIMREQHHDLALGYPVQDFTAVKKKLADGAEIHDVAHEMDWAFQEAFQLVETSLAGGEEHRTQLMSMYARQLPMNASPWGWGAGPWGGMGGPQDQEQDPDSPPDKRPAMFNVGGFFGRNGQNNGQDRRRGKGGGRVRRDER